jgi:hypothetical protein
VILRNRPPREYRLQILETRRTVKHGQLPRVLAACELEIAIYPMTQVLEEEGAPSHNEVLGSDSLIPQFVLRVGYLDRYPTTVGLRRPVAWFVYS